MYKVNLKKIAKNLEKRAKNLAEMTYKKERSFNLPYDELKNLHKKTFERNKQAGDMWKKAGNYKKAIQMYQEAVNFAPSERIELKIKEEIISLYGNGKKRLEKRLFVSVISLNLLWVLFFVSLNLTGNVSGASEKVYNIIGIILFFVGLTIFISFKKKREF